jgi:hypothetical protein
VVSSVSAAATAAAVAVLDPGERTVDVDTLTPLDSVDRVVVGPVPTTGGDATEGPPTVVTSSPATTGREGPRPTGAPPASGGVPTTPAGSTTTADPSTATGAA